MELIKVYVAGLYDSPYREEIFVSYKEKLCYEVGGKFFYHKKQKTGLFEYVGHKLKSDACKANLIGIDEEILRLCELKNLPDFDFTLLAVEYVHKTLYENEIEEQLEKEEINKGFFNHMLYKYKQLIEYITEEGWTK